MSRCLRLIAVVLFQTMSVLHGATSNSIHTSKDDDWSNALPFYRTLNLTSPEMYGRDVMILQNLLRRHPNINLTATGVFDPDTRNALKIFQADLGIEPADGTLNSNCAIKILDNLIFDGYKDDGKIPKDVKFKLYIPVYRDRNIETTAILYGSDGTILYKFRARTHGSSTDKGKVRNQLTTNGSTPTGLSHMDLNSKEPILKSFGPYPVLRVVKGIQGNSAIGRDNHTSVDGQETFLSNYRSGILVHTGQWDNWEKGDPMPNSNGCIHVAPEDQKKIVELLVENCGCVVNENPFGELPYPFKSQGIVSIEQID